jgi:chromosome partitioning protein
MVTITFSHHKGGTGKTTSCLNIAGFCAREGKKVLVVDCDPQANATAGLGIRLQDSDRNMYDVFMSGIEDFPETRIIDIIKRTDSGIDLAPSHLDLVGTDPYLYRTPNRAGILKEALSRIKDSYDLILVDTAPSMGQLVINGLFAADRIIVTLDSGTFALDGVATMNTIFGDIKEGLGKEIRPDMAIVTRWGEGIPPACDAQEPAGQQDLLSLIRNLFYKKPEPTPAEEEAKKERTAEHERLEAILAEIRRHFPLVYTVPFSPTVYEAQKRGLPLSHCAPDSSAGTAYKTIADEVLRWI